MFRSIAGDNIGADVRAMLADDYDFEVDDIFNQMGEHDAARVIQRFIARSARQNRRRRAPLWRRLGRRGRFYTEPGITRNIRRFL